VFVCVRLPCWMLHIPVSSGLSLIDRWTPEVHFPMSVEPVNLTVHSLSDIPSDLFFLCISLSPGGNVLWVVVTSAVCSGGKGFSPHILFFLFDFTPSHGLALVKSVLLNSYKIHTLWYLSSFPTSSQDTCDITVKKCWVQFWVKCWVKKCNKKM